MKCRHNKGMVTAWVFLLLAAFAVAQSNRATVPRLVRFSGLAKDETNHAKTGVLGVTFALYKDQEGGSPLWLEVQNVQADSSGHYTALLGTTKPDGIPAELFTSNEARWLSVQIEGQAEQPRVLFVSVPYALKAADAETIGGLPPSAFVRTNPEGTSSPGTVERPASSNATAPSNSAAPVTNLTVITPSPGQPSSFVPLWTGNSPSHTLGSSALFQKGANAIGLNTKTPGATLEIDSPSQLGLFVNGPFVGVGSGIQLHTTGTGGKGWEILATGKTAVQGLGKLNIRDLSTNADVFTIAPGGLVGIGTINPTTPLDVQGNLGGAPSSFVMAVENSGTGGGLTIGTNGTNQALSIANTNSGGGVAITSGGLAVSSFSPALQAAALNGGPGVVGLVEHDANFAVGVRGQAAGGTSITLGMDGSTASTIGVGAFGHQLGGSGVLNSFLGVVGAGVWGDSGGTGGSQVGVVGTADDAIGVGAHTNGSGSPALYAQNDTTVAGSLLFDAIGANGGGECNIDIGGNLKCNGVQITSANASNGRSVALYGVSAAESWFEDVGSAQLFHGMATIELEKTFAQTVNATMEYHIFLTPKGDCKGLYVATQNPQGFSVRELGGGASNISFDYRIMARRKGYESKRLEDVTAGSARPRWQRNNKPVALPSSLASGPRSVRAQR